uniref:Uncharacterized protein n=1 Tax=Alexandrium monilatum TaxID=311494 RepID=A0A7S4TAV9_9DINO
MAQDILAQSDFGPSAAPSCPESLLDLGRAAMAEVKSWEAQDLWVPGDDNQITKEAFLRLQAALVDLGDALRAAKEAWYELDEVKALPKEAFLDEDLEKRPNVLRSEPYRSLMKRALELRRVYAQAQVTAKKLGGILEFPDDVPDTYDPEKPELIYPDLDKVPLVPGRNY